MEPEYNTLVEAINHVYNRAPRRFEVGALVRLKTGKSPMRVTKVGLCGKNIKTEYLSSRKQLDWRDIDAFEHYHEPETKIEKEAEMTHKLYKTLEGARYGEYRAKDGDKILLLMSDSGTYEAFAPEAIKRVMPYTYDVMFTGTGKVYSYIGTEGEVAVGDILLGDSMTLAQVVAVGTESESATKRFKGAKLVTTPLAS
jgi:hypothetical protein